MQFDNEGNLITKDNEGNQVKKHIPIDMFKVANILQLKSVGKSKEQILPHLLEYYSIISKSDKHKLLDTKAFLEKFFLDVYNALPEANLENIKKLSNQSKIELLTTRLKNNKISYSELSKNPIFNMVINQLHKGSTNPMVAIIDVGADGSIPNGIRNMFVNESSAIKEQKIAFKANLTAMFEDLDTLKTQFKLLSDTFVPETKNLEGLIEKLNLNKDSIEAKSQEVSALLKSIGIDVEDIYVHYQIKQLLDFVESKQFDSKLNLDDYKTTEIQDNLFLKLNSYFTEYNTLLSPSSEKDSLADEVNIELFIDRLFNGKSGIVGRLNGVFRGNSEYDETLRKTTFKNAENKTIYEFIYNNYMVETFKLFKDVNFMNFLDELRKTDFSNAYKKQLMLDQLKEFYKGKLPMHKETADNHANDINNAVVESLLLHLKNANIDETVIANLKGIGYNFIMGMRGAEYAGGNEKKSTKSNDGISYATASKMDQFLTMISSFRSGFIMSPNIVGKSMQVAYRPNKIMSYEENEAKERFFNIFMKEYNRVSTENEIAKLKDLDGYSKRRTNYYNNKELVNYFKNEARKDSSMYKLLNGEKTLDEVKEAIKDEILKYHTEYKINELYNDIITLAEGKDKLNSVIDSMLGSKKLDVTTMDILEDNDDEVETNEENEEKPVVTLTERNEELMKENLRLLHYNTTVYNEVLLDLLYGDMSLGLKDVIDAGKRTGGWIASGSSSNKDMSIIHIADTDDVLNELSGLGNSAVNKALGEKLLAKNDTAVSMIKEAINSKTGNTKLLKLQKAIAKKLEDKNLSQEDFAVLKEAEFEVDKLVNFSDILKARIENHKKDSIITKEQLEELIDKELEGTIFNTNSVESNDAV